MHLVNQTHRYLDGFEGSYFHSSTLKNHYFNLQIMGAILWKLGLPIYLKWSIERRDDWPISPKSVRVVVLKDSRSSSYDQPSSQPSTLSPSCSRVTMNLATTSPHQLLVAVGVQLDNSRHTHSLTENRHPKQKWRCRPHGCPPPTERSPSSPLLWGKFWARIAFFVREILLFYIFGFPLSFYLFIFRQKDWCLWLDLV